VVGCHRQADRTTDRLRASVLRFGLVTKDQVRQSLAEKVDYHLDLRSDRRHIQATVEVEHHFAVGQALDPQLRNLALVELEGFVLCVVCEHQGIEAVFVVDFSLHPRSASGAVADSAKHFYEGLFFLYFEGQNLIDFIFRMPDHGGLTNC
jgi:hypothetical protein